MVEDDYDDYPKEFNHYRKSKDRGRGRSTNDTFVYGVVCFNLLPLTLYLVFF